MKKYFTRSFLATFIVSLALSASVFIPTVRAQAQTTSMCQLVDMLIIIGVIPAEKIDAARAAMGCANYFNVRSGDQLGLLEQVLRGPATYHVANWDCKTSGTRLPTWEEAVNRDVNPGDYLSEYGNIDSERLWTQTECFQGYGTSWKGIPNSVATGRDLTSNYVENNCTPTNHKHYYQCVANDATEIEPVVPTRPFITILSPNGGENYFIGNKLSIKINTNISEKTASGITVQLYKKTNDSFGKMYVRDIVKNRYQGFPYDWIIPADLSTGDYYIYAAAENLVGTSGEVIDFSDGYFTINNSVTINEPPTIVNTYTLTIPAQLNGSISLNPDKSNYNSGESVIITATPSSGYKFINWRGGLSGSENPKTTVMEGDKTVTASFGQIDNKLTIVAENGRVIKDPDKSIYNYGDTLTLTAIPDQGFTFSKWTVRNTSGNVVEYISGPTNTNPTITVKMYGDREMIANFLPSTSSALDSSSGSYASVVVGWDTVVKLIEALK